MCLELNLRQFRYAQVLAEKQSFSLAADELNISQPSLSQYVKRLENELGVVLFDRGNGTTVRLTDAGRVYLEAGKRILDTERQMKNRFSDIDEGKTGTVVVGIAPTRCQYLMPEIVKRFEALYPGMHLIIEERFLSDLIDDAEHGLFDLCVATLPVDERIFSYELMMREEIVLAVPENLPVCGVLTEKAGARSDRLYPAVDIRLIDGADMVLLSETQPTQVLLNGFLSQYDLRVRTAVQCMSIETQFGMVKAGIGAALIPSSLAKYSKADNVRFFSLEQETPLREMAVIYRKDQYFSHAITDLKEIMTSV